jgi:putative N-acetyltransferase (TIGR04045 family)
MIVPFPFEPYVPPQFGIKLAREAWEFDEHARLRREVFVREQRLFVGDDRDEHDARALPIVAVDYVMNMPYRVVGTVRVSPAERGLWFGSRLAIERAYRTTHGLGSGLVARAVGTAKARGCRRFEAMVQAQNVAFFRRLRFEPLEELVLFGAPHVRMRADLAAYPACGDDEPAGVIRTRRAS